MVVGAVYSFGGAPGRLLVLHVGFGGANLVRAMVGEGGQDDREQRVLNQCLSSWARGLHQGALDDSPRGIFQGVVPQSADAGESPPFL